MSAPDNLKTPLKKVRGLGSAKSGTEHFWHQRATGAANLVLIICMIWFLLAHLSATRAEIVSSLHNPIIALVLVLGLGSIFWHMRLGMQVIIEDYVHAPLPKFAALAFNTAFPIALFALSAYSILKMSFAL